MIDVSGGTPVETWAHTDRLGSVMATTSGTGTVTQTYRYSPYGRPGAEGNSGFPFRFTGQRLDAETGLYYYKARYYDPETGRFLQADPIGYADNLNLYAYVGNDPTNKTNPLGLYEGDGWKTHDPEIYRNADYEQMEEIWGEVIEWTPVLSGLKGTAEFIHDPTLANAANAGLSVFGPIAKGAGKMLKAVRGAPKSTGPLHHVCTNKNCISKARGGPWTPRFEAIFEKAGMNLEDGLNKVRVPGHAGPHPEAYHRAVYDRLINATDGLSGSAYKTALQRELQAIGQEAATAGSMLNKLIVKP